MADLILQLWVAAVSPSYTHTHTHTACYVEGLLQVDNCSVPWWAVVVLPAAAVGRRRPEALLPRVHPLPYQGGSCQWSDALHG
jgi:hypothetical protein